MQHGGCIDEHGCCPNAEMFKKFLRGVKGIACVVSVGVLFVELWVSGQKLWCMPGGNVAAVIFDANAKFQDKWLKAFIAIWMLVLECGYGEPSLGPIWKRIWRKLRFSYKFVCGALGIRDLWIEGWRTLHHWRILLRTFPTAPIPRSFAARAALGAGRLLGWMFGLTDPQAFELDQLETGTNGQSDSEDLSSWSDFEEEIVPYPSTSGHVREPADFIGF
jgi:hypothetical protein